MTKAFVLTAIFASVRALGADPSPELMNRLAEHDARIRRANQEGIYTTTTLAEELDGDGKVAHTQTTVIQVSHRDGKREQVLVKAEKDGADISTEQRKKMKQGAGAPVATPFASTEQPKYHFSVVGPDSADASLLRIHFEPTGGQKSDKLFIGDALVDLTSGELISVSGRPSENPSHINRLEMRLEFNGESPLGRVLGKLTMRGDGGFLFIKKHFRATTVFSSFRGTLPQRLQRTGRKQSDPGCTARPVHRRAAG